MSVARPLRLSAILAAAAFAIIIGFFACPGRSGSGSAPATLVSMAVTPSNPTIALGTTRQFSATGTYSDGTTEDLTTLATWSSSVATAGTISNAAGTRGLASGVAAGSTTISATMSGVNASTTLTVSSAALVSIAVTPTNPRNALGTSRQFAATGTFADGSTQDLTGQVDWQSSSVTSATISNAVGSNGLASSIGIGDATISAAFSGVSGSTTLTVTAAVLVSIGVTPTNPTIALGTNQPFAATGVFSDGTIQDLTTQVTWASSGGAATVSNVPGSNGDAHGANLGSTTISAAFTGISGATTLTVSPAVIASVAVTPTNPVIALGTTQALAATGIFTDGTVQDLTDQATWVSSVESVATVSNVDGSRGVVSAVAMGNTAVSAMFAGLVGSTSLTVSNATLVSIDITPNLSSVALGTTQSFVATGTYSDSSTEDLTGAVTWASSDESIASVSNADGSRGLATSVGIGSATISATLSGVSGSTSLVVSSAALVAIAVSPDATQISKGTVQPFSALGLLSDGTRQDVTDQVTWSSSDAAVATISNAVGSHGLVTSVAVGSATISASLSGVSGSTTLDVSGAALVSIDVFPFITTIAKGTQVQFSALGNYSDFSTQDLTAQATWSGADAGMVSVSNAAGSEGLVTGVGVGSTTLSATFSGIVGTVNLTVSDAVLDSITVTPAGLSLPVGMSPAFTATGVFSDASTQDLTTLVTWSSSDTAVATVSNAAGSEGSAWSVGGGTATIAATYSGKSGATSLTVTTATLDSISISPLDALVPWHYWTPFQAIGNYSDGSSTNLTTQVVWTSSNTNVVTISNSVGSEGRGVGSSPGTATVTAARAGVTSSTSLTVTNETLSSITVDPPSVTLAVGEKAQMTATGFFSGGSIVDITAQVRWSTNPRSTATIGNATTKGLVTARRGGSATIKASKGNRHGTASLSVP